MNVMTDGRGNLNSLENETGHKGLNNSVPPETKDNLNIILGHNEKGAFSIDLQKVPHLLIAGAPGTGKTSFVESLLVKMICQNSPESVQIIIYTSDDSQYAGFDNNPYIIEKRSIDHHELRTSFEAIVELIDYRLSHSSTPRSLDEYSDLFIVIDDCSFITQYSWAKQMLYWLIQDGRIAKIHLVLVTSTPLSSDIPPRIRDGIPHRIAFNTGTGSISRVLINKFGAEKLQIPGQMILKGPNILEKLDGIHLSDLEIRTTLRQSTAEYNGNPSSTNILFQSLKNEIEEESIAASYNYTGTGSQSYTAEGKRPYKKKEPDKTGVKAKIDNKKSPIQQKLTLAGLIRRIMQTLFLKNID